MSFLDFNNWFSVIANIGGTAVVLGSCYRFARKVLAKGRGGIEEPRVSWRDWITLSALILVGVISWAFACWNLVEFVRGSGPVTRSSIVGVAVNTATVVMGLIGVVFVIICGVLKGMMESMRETVFGLYETQHMLVDSHRDLVGALLPVEQDNVSESKKAVGREASKKKGPKRTPDVGS